ncbi:Ubiquilin-4 [Mortierella sp. GBA30]|nr:Ubiquilin-4 [Mortierella sp. GBA30]
MEDSETGIRLQAIVLTIRPSSGSTFTTAISTDSTVLHLKEKLATADLPASSIRLVYSGRVLKDEDQLSLYSIKEGHTIHMVKSATNRANEQAAQTVRPPNSTRNPTGAPEGFDEQAMLNTLLDNPAIRDMMANPELVRRMMMSNPQTREVMENNPEVAQMLNDPSFLRQSLDIARNPKLMKQALRNNDRALSNLEMIPGGFNHLRRMYHSVQEPMEASRSAPEPSTDDLNERFAARLNADTRPNAGALNTTALPNPWAPPPRPQNSASGAGSLFSGMSGGMGGFNPFGPSPFASLDGTGAGSRGGVARSGAQQGSTPPFPNPLAAMMSQRMGGTRAGPQTNPFGLPPLGAGEGFSSIGPNPEMFQQMMQFNQMMRQMQQQQPSQPSSQIPPLPFPSFANMFGGLPPVVDPTALTNTSSTSALPNSNHNNNNNNTTAATGNMTTAAPSASSASTQLPEERFETQLASLRDMGFSDTSRNVRALLASGGDVNSAIEFLLRM